MAARKATVVMVIIIVFVSFHLYDVHFLRGFGNNVTVNFLLRLVLVNLVPDKRLFFILRRSMRVWFDG